MSRCGSISHRNRGQTTVLPHSAESPDNLPGNRGLSPIPTRKPWSVPYSQGVEAAGVIESRAGKVRLYKPDEYPADWVPETDARTPTWEALHRLVRALRAGGETEAGGLLAHMPERTESIRQLAYRLYTLCEHKSWAEDARAYNELIAAWPGIEVASHAAGHASTQVELEI